MGKADYFNEEKFMVAFDTIMLAGEMATGRVAVQDLKDEAKERAQEIADEVKEDVKKVVEEQKKKALEDGKMDEEDAKRIKEAA